MTRLEQFATLVSAVAREVMRRRSSETCCGDLTLEQFETLRVVARAEPATVTIGALSAALAVDVSTMSRNVSVLERNGTLARAKSPDDGRVVRVTLTAKGRGALSTLKCGERDVLADVYDRIPAGQRAGVIEALEALRAGLEPSDQAGDQAACCAPVPLRRRAS
jgi:DNA-binding MarR family transcriptional regulator